MKKLLTERKAYNVFRLILSVLTAMGLMRPDVGSAQKLGDRIVVAINDQTYTQRQVESYITLKECLRKPSDSPQAVNLITKQNWTDALSVFIEDMILLQEVIRLGSYQDVSQLIDQYETIVKGKLSTHATLAAHAKRLGFNDLTIAKTLEDILRIAYFRRSKMKQANLIPSSQRESNEDLNNFFVERGDDSAGSASESAVAEEQTQKWFKVLVEQSRVRRFEGADVYVEIFPNQGN